MSDSDAQLEIKKRARRRLVGAIALLLAAAIILPMVMDSEPKPSGNELQIRIPSQEGGNYASRLITGAPPAPAAEAPAEPSATAPEVQSAPVPTPAAGSTPAAKPDVAVLPAPVKPNIVETKSEPKVSPQPADLKPAPKTDDTARAKAILEGQSVAAVPHKFYVQLGAYRDTANVKSLQTRLKAAGFASTTEKIGQKTRVRAGPFPNRPAAERALVKLKKLGLSGVVAPAK